MKPYPLKRRHKDNTTKTLKQVQGDPNCSALGQSKKLQLYRHAELVSASQHLKNEYTNPNENPSVTSVEPLRTLW